MSITKITDPAAVPATVADYTAQNTHSERLLVDSVQPYPVSGSNVVKGALFNIGGDMFYCDADTAISGTPSDYVKLVVSGSTATPSFVASLSGVAWNSAYNGYYNGVDLYVFDEVKAVLAGAIAGYNTAMGALFETVIDQGVKSTDNVDFVTVNTGQGDNELYRMNQDVRDIDNVRFSNMFYRSKRLEDPAIGVNFWHSNTGDENTIFDLLTSFIPQTGDIMLITGVIGTQATGTEMAVSRAERTSSTLITIYGFYVNKVSNFPSTRVNTNGGSALRNGSLAW